MKRVSIEIPDGMSTKWVNGLLTLVEDKDDRNITERVRSYEDACEILGIKPIANDNLCIGVNIPETAATESHVKSAGDMDKDMIAYIKLTTIIKALNEGWKPSLKEDEYRYYPWFYLYTQEELDNMDQSEREQRRGLLFGGNANYGSAAGFGCASTYNAPSNANATFGSRLCLKNDELARYCAEQFIELWFEFLFPDMEITKNNWED